MHTCKAHARMQAHLLICTLTQTHARTHAHARTIDAYQTHTYSYTTYEPCIQILAHVIVYIHEYARAKTLLHCKQIRTYALTDTHILKYGQVLIINAHMKPTYLQLYLHAYPHFFTYIRSF